MSINRAFEVLPTLKRLAKTKDKSQRQKLLASCPCKVYSVLGDIAKNVLKGHISVPKKYMSKLKLYKNDIRRFAANKSSAKRRKALIQKGGFLPLLLKPALTLLATYVGSKLAER